jgi:hypothetical protein
VVPCICSRLGAALLNVAGPLLGSPETRSQCANDLRVSYLPGEFRRRRSEGVLTVFAHLRSSTTRPHRGPVGVQLPECSL